MKRYICRTSTEHTTIVYADTRRTRSKRHAHRLPGLGHDIETPIEVEEELPP